jgi:hypothetical protein
VANVFISYARRDRERVLVLASALEREGLSVWWDPNLVPGKRFRDIIARELAAADSVVVVWTTASIQSDYVQDEAEEARERGVLVPITLEPIKPPAGFRQVQAADLSQWTGSGQHPEFRMLLTAVHTLVEAARADETAELGAPVDTEAPAATTSAPTPPDPVAAADRRLRQDPQPQLTPQPAAAPDEAPHDEALLPRLFDLLANSAVWLIGALLVALSGLYVSFGLSGTAAAMVIWAGAMAQAGRRRMGSSRKTTVMVVSLGVAAIVAASTHSAHGAVTAVLVGGAVFAGVATIMVATPGRSRRASANAATRDAYRRYWERKILSDMGDERWRERRRRRANSDAAPDP